MTKKEQRKRIAQALEHHILATLDAAMAELKADLARVAEWKDYHVKKARYMRLLGRPAQELMRYVQEYRKKHRKDGIKDSSVIQIMYRFEHAAWEQEFIDEHNRYTPLKYQDHDLLYLNGFTCLSCGQGWYDGYDPNDHLTRPCEHCGHQAPASMEVGEFRKMIAERDAARTKAESIK